MLAQWISWRLNILLRRSKKEDELITPQVERPLKLPELAGPHKNIGFVDVEWGDGQLYARLYYPSKEPVETPTKWIPYPDYMTAYGDFIRMPRLLSRTVTRVLVGAAEIPAGEALKPGINGACPLVIFSHGLGACRTTYSSICTQLASFGYLVAAIEHRDGSACLTLTHEHQRKLPYEHATGIAPYDPRQFSDEVAARGVGEHTWRNSQLHMRAKEMSSLLDALLLEPTQNQIDDDKSVVSLDVEDLLRITWSPSGDKHFEILRQFMSCINRDRVYVAGHSFGGATAILSATRNPRFKACLSLDPWMYPFETDVESWFQRPFPLLIINSYTFQWAENLLALRKLMDKLNVFDQTGVQMTLLGSTHQEFGDFPCLVSTRVLNFMRGHAGTINPELAIYATVAAWRAFLGESKYEAESDSLWSKAEDAVDFLLRSDYHQAKEPKHLKVPVDEIFSLDHVVTARHL